ncbi:tetratricopeptide repeat protein [Geitlerinema sp. PCC 7407]|uniref:tetratricopeptide repeat protein n=1 Tax=Geitlerinema sp. PCC 7407 TaxID=1173025 RepID=UPI00029FD43E|nr:tetratricopeptide repeat protein [Geitlerinema sp. PCC 7407]AFY66537.1 Tetratricopeptide TPR_1 repeat-containing protein [Geitlerinema sp. PCC 7407]
MTTDSFDWDDELPPETEEEVYRALLRALRRKQGFGLFFVQCTPAQGKKIVANLRRDLAQQRIEEMHLEGEVLTLYDRLTALWKAQPFDVLIVEGLQHSLYAYEDTKRFSGWSSSEIYNYSWKGVPQILNHLNQQRERLRDEFPARFVFLVPPFVVDYFIQRAADFLDWRSGLFRFPRDPQDVLKEAKFLVDEHDFEQYFKLSFQERVAKTLELKTSLQALEDLSDRAPTTQSISLLPTLDYQVDIAFDLSHLFMLEGDYKSVITSLNKVLHLNPNSYLAWINRGVAFSYLGQYEDALVSFGKAIKLDSHDSAACFNQGVALSHLGRYEDALISFDKAIKLDPNDSAAWFNRGFSLYRLDRYEDAVISFDDTLRLNSNDYLAWTIRGISLDTLGYYEDAIFSLDSALKIKSDFHMAWIGRGISFDNLGHYDDAISSYERSLELDPDFHPIWFLKAGCHGLQAQADLAIASLQKAIALDTKYKEMARTDSDFDAIREDERFQALLRE